MKETDNPGHTSTVDVIEEVKRRQQERQPSPTGKTKRLVVAADRLIFWLSKRWLSIFNSFALIYVGLPLLAPTLMHLGAERAGSLIYTMYGPLCHQLPQRSWFLFGPKIAYRLPELMERAGSDVAGAFSPSFIGNEALGYKVAFCQRDVAIYGAIFLFGIVYGLLRRRWDVRPLPWWAYILIGLVPMGLDGGYQLLSYVLPLILPSAALEPYETTPLMRVITGTLFGGATVWLAYPYVQASMDDVQSSLKQRFGWT